MLADFEITKALQDNWLGIEPYDPARLQPVSYDLTLDPAYLRIRGDVHTIDTAMDTIDTAMDIDDGKHYGRVPSWHPHTTGHVIPAHGLTVRPGEFLLACTVETIILTSSIAARVEGKSSLGRLGMLVHATAGFIDPGFTGQVTLEIANISGVSIVLYPGMPICQLTFEPVSPVERDYSVTGHYQGQTGPTQSRYRHRR